MSKTEWLPVTVEATGAFESGGLVVSTVLQYVLLQ
jgi:hypothetical protein